MALPSSNITTSMVGEKLGTTSRNVGYLCTYEWINKWSKWKPIRSNLITIDNDELEDKNWGINIPLFTSVLGVVNAIRGGDDTYEWEYRRPLGGQASPYRLGDFRNYEKDAYSPIGQFSYPKKINPSDKVSMGVLVAEGEQWILGWNELISTNDRLGIALYKNGIAFSRSGAMIDSNNSIKVFFPDDIEAGDYALYFFIKTGNWYQPIDSHPKNGFPIEVTNIIAQVRVFGTAIRDPQNPNRVNVQILARNTMGHRVTLTGAEIQLRFWQNDWMDALESGEQQVNVGSVEIPPTQGTNTVVIWEDSFAMLPDRQYKVMWRNGGLYPQDFSLAILSERPSGGIDF